MEHEDPIPFVFTRGATAGLWRLAVVGIATSTSIRFVLTPDRVPQFVDQGCTKHKRPTKECVNCGVANVGAKEEDWNPNPRAKYHRDSCKLNYARWQSRQPLRGEEARKARKSLWRLFDVYGIGQATGAPPPKRQRKKGGEA
jgi:hypothetical protein